LGWVGRISVVAEAAAWCRVQHCDAFSFRRKSHWRGLGRRNYATEAAQAAWKQIVGRLNAAGKRPVVDGVFPFEEVKAAFARLAQGPMERC